MFDILMFVFAVSKCELRRAVEESPSISCAVPVIIRENSVATYIMGKITGCADRHAYDILRQSVVLLA